MVVQLHGEADDIVPLTGEQGSGDRGVHAARHGYHYTHTFIANIANILGDHPTINPNRQTLVALRIAP
jgi:hypothetical protein